MNMFEICKLNQKQYRILYSKEQKEFIDNMPELNGNEWDNKRNLDYTIWKRSAGVKIEELKQHIKKALIEAQGRYCAYCGMKLELTSEIQIEHIAPKGKGRYPWYMFHSSNLVLACSLCNGFLKKENKEYYDTIDREDDDKYEKSDFNIVHPYLDDPDQHFVLGSPINKGIIISPKIIDGKKSIKGQNSINVFTLYDEPQTNGRWHHYVEYKYDFDSKYRQAFEEACSPNEIKDIY